MIGRTQRVRYTARGCTLSPRGEPTENGQDGADTARGSKWRQPTFMAVVRAKNLGN